MKNHMQNFRCVSKCFKFLVVLTLFFMMPSVAAMSSGPILSDGFRKGDVWLEIPTNMVSTRNVKDKIALFYGKDGFVVGTGGEYRCIHSYDTDQSLRGANFEKIITHTLLEGLRVSQFDNGEYRVQLRGGLKGGGIGGATAGFYAGKFLVHFVGHGAILIAGVCTGPAAPATIAALEATFLPTIEAASNIVALGTAIAGGTITGPI